MQCFTAVSFFLPLRSWEHGIKPPSAYRSLSDEEEYSSAADPPQTHSRRENLSFHCFQLLSFWVACFCSVTAPMLIDVAWLTAQVSSPALQSPERTAQATCTTHLASWTLASQLLHLQSCPLSFQLSTHTCGPHHLHPQLSCLWKNELRQFPAFSSLFSSKSPVT